MSDWTIAGIAVVWGVGWLGTSVVVFRDWQRRYPMLAKKERMSDATFALAWSFFMWPFAALVWGLGRSLGFLIMWLGAIDRKDWRP